MADPFIVAEILDTMSNTHSLQAGMASLDQMECELNNMLVQDNRYWRENDAKFRAVAQNATYEQFEDIVKASHLKPLDKTDKSPNSKSKTSIWSSITSATSRKSSGDPKPLISNEVMCSGTTPLGMVVPRNIDEFQHRWRNVEICDRIGFVQDLGQSAISKIFSTEIPPELLADFLYTFLTFGPSLTDLVVVVQTLETLALAKRFSLSVQFLSAMERQTAGQLVEKLRAGLVDRQQDLAERGVTEWQILLIAKKFLVE